MSHRVPLCFAMLLLAAASPLAQPREPEHFLRTYIGFGDEEMDRLARGDVVTKALDTPVAREVAIFGAVWIEATTELFLERYLDIETFESGPGVSQIRKIGDPPVLVDFTPIRIPEEDLDAIQSCRVGDCDVKLDAGTLERLQREVDWSSEDAHEKAQALLAQVALEFVEGYRSGGNAALGVLRDKKRPTFLAQELVGLIANSPYLFTYLPELHRYLLYYPEAELPGATSFLYWSKNDFGLKPVIRINHVVAYRLAEGGNASVAIASKQLYASHYFYTALELRFLARDTARRGPSGFYLLNLNRSRSDGLTGLFGSLVRSSAQGRALEGLGSYLRSSKERVERVYANPRRPLRPHSNRMSPLGKEGR